MMKKFHAFKLICIILCSFSLLFACSNSGKSSNAGSDSSNVDNSTGDDTPSDEPEKAVKVEDILALLGSSEDNPTIFNIKASDTIFNESEAITGSSKRLIAYLNLNNCRDVNITPTEEESSTFKYANVDCFTDKDTRDNNKYSKFIEDQSKVAMWYEDEKLNIAIRIQAEGGNSKLFSAGNDAHEYKYYVISVFKNWGYLELDTKKETLSIIDLSLGNQRFFSKNDMSSVNGEVIGEGVSTAIILNLVWNYKTNSLDISMKSFLNEKLDVSELRESTSRTRIHAEGGSKEGTSKLENKMMIK